MVPYVVGTVTVMYCCLCCMCVCCQVDENAGVGSGGDVVAVSAYMGGTRGSETFVTC